MRVALAFALAIAVLPAVAALALPGPALVGALPSPTSRAAGVWLGDHALVFGGICDESGRWAACDQIVRVEPDGSSRIVGRMPFPLVGSAAVAVGGKVYLVAGLTAHGYGTTGIHEYDPATGYWNTVAALPFHGGLSELALVTDGDSVYVLGGATDILFEPSTDVIFRFDPATYRVERLAQRLPFPLFWHSAVWDPHAERAYVFGGTNGELDNLATTTRTVLVLDLRGGSPPVVLPTPHHLLWTSAAWEPPGAACAQGCVHLFNANALAESQPVPILRFDAATLSLAPTASFVPGPRFGATAAWAGGLALLIGGEALTPSADVFAYAP